MSTGLETKLNRILTEKNEKILPENIKKGIKIFDVEGTYGIEETEDYAVCNTLAGQIIGDLPVDNDKYIEVTNILDMTSENINVVDGTLVIE